MILVPLNFCRDSEPIYRTAEFAVYPEGLWDDGAGPVLAGQTIGISLERRRDRRVVLDEWMRKHPWPLPPLEWVRARDGAALVKPTTFRGNAAAWGCLRSHVYVLGEALAAGVPSVSIFEDDAMFCADFAGRLRAFMAAVPDDWELLMLGGAGGRRRPVNGEVDRISGALMTHAYVVRGSLLPRLLAAMDQEELYSDQLLAQFQGQCHAYAPREWLVAQRAGWSDIEGVERRSGAFAEAPAPTPPAESLEFYTRVWKVMNDRPGHFTLHHRDGRTFQLSNDGGVIRVSPGVLGLFHVADAPLSPHWGPPLWRRLHTGALTAATPEARLALVAEISDALPRRCDCRGHWRKVLLELPPAVASAAEFFEWTVEAHNRVNARRGAAEIPLTAARGLYATAD